MGVNNFHFYYRNVNNEFPGIFRHVFFFFLIISWLFYVYIYLCIFFWFFLFFIVCFVRRPLSVSAVRIRTLQSPG